MKRLLDILAPKGDTIQILLKKRGKTVAAIYKDDEREIRSPSLKKDKAADDASDLNTP
ncbi:MAG TPA: hypothetical protein VLA34_12730 [Candidatus Krumholzibacterium sp.]|nr:hypothetical protein [Candidatus Krumholzibacterium sp.]